MCTNGTPPSRSCSFLSLVHKKINFGANHPYFGPTNGQPIRLQWEVYILIRLNDCKLWWCYVTFSARWPSQFTFKRSGRSEKKANNLPHQDDTSHDRHRVEHVIALPTPAVNIPPDPQSRTKDTSREYPRASPDPHIRFAARTASHYSTAIWYECYKGNWVPSIFPPSYVDLPQSILRELSAKSVDKHQMSFRHFSLALQYPKLYPEAYKYKVWLLPSSGLLPPAQPFLWIWHLGSSPPLLVCCRHRDGGPINGTIRSLPSIMAAPRSSKRCSHGSASTR